MPRDVHQGHSLWDMDGRFRLNQQVLLVQVCVDGNSPIRSLGLTVKGLEAS